jgi:hypothetical protein
LIKFRWQGAYAGGTAYVKDDVVSYNGSSYVCILASTGNLPTDTTYWNVMAQGGTDITSLAGLAQGDILYYNGTDWVRLGAGTSGDFLKTQGAGANPVWASAGGGLQSIQSFTSSGTYTKPSGINKIKVYITGGGGGGGSSNSTVHFSGAGGAGGGTAIELLDATSITTVSVTIGSGGTAGQSGSSQGGHGGTSSFGSYCSATGGDGGHYAGAINGVMSGGIGSNGDLNLKGDAPQGGADNNQFSNTAGRGGGSFWGGAGFGRYNGAGENGTLGGGGGGGNTTNGTEQSGGTGGDGFCVVEEYK